MLIDVLNTFSGDIESERHSNTPDSPGSIILRIQVGDLKLSPKDQQEYQSGVGYLLYLLKNYHPDLANVVRGLTKVMDIAHYGHLKNLYLVLKYVNDTRYYGVYLKPDGIGDAVWKIVGFYDSDWDSDRDDRKVSRSGPYSFIISL